MRIGFVAAMMTIVALAWAAPAAAGIVVTVDKSAQRMKVVVDGVEKYDWPVSTGAKDYVTPSGTFNAFRLEKDHKSQEWDNAPMPHSTPTERPPREVRGGQNPDAGFALPKDTYWFLGHDGQSIAVIPSKKLVVVRLGLTPSKLGYKAQALVAALAGALD